MTSKIPAKINSGLYIVATPIGNLGDISLRALEILKSVDAIACEDTRTSAVLLKAYGISTPTFSCHEHNENQVASSILQRIEGGEAIALISDAGTPLISDPGYRLVRSAQERGIYVTTIPGASSITAALTISGMPSDSFMFAGFLPPKHEARLKKLKGFAAIPATMIFLEAPHRLAATLADMATLWPERAAAVVREISKKFEEVKYHTLAELADFYADNEARGEIVILLHPPEEKAADENEWHGVLAERIKEVPLSQAVAEVAENFSVPRKIVYAAALRIKL